MKTELDIGIKYNKWLVKSFDCVDSHRRRRYICQCECGIEKSLIASAVMAGRTRSCNRCRRDDLVGKEFGRWTVIKKHDKTTLNKTVWLCRCRCGAESLVIRSNLTSGKSQGCWICQRDVINTQYFPRTWYRKLIEQAKCRNREWALSETELWNLWQLQKGKCALSGLPIIIDKDLIRTTASLDRIDNAKGYISGNCWFIHKHINMMKHKYSVDYFVRMCKAIVSQKIDVNPYMEQTNAALYNRY